MKATKISIVLGVFALGCAFGWVCHPAAEKAPAVDAGERTVSKVVHDNRDGQVRVLKDHIRRLEQALAKAQRKSSSVATNGVPAVVPDAPDPNGRHRGGPPRLSELAKKDPKRYAEITNRIAHFRAASHQRSADRLEVLAGVDTSRMSDRERTTHEKYQELLAKQTELRDNMPGPEDETVTQEERRTYFDTLREVDRQLRDLAEEERTTLLKQTVRNLGLSGNDAQEAIDAVKLVYESTQNVGGHGGPGGPPPHGR